VQWSPPNRRAVRIELATWSEPPPEWLDSRHWSALPITDHGSSPSKIDASHPRCLLTSNLALRRGGFARIGVFSPDFPRAQDHEIQLRFWLGGADVRSSSAWTAISEAPDAGGSTHDQSVHTSCGRRSCGGRRGSGGAPLGQQDDEIAYSGTI